MQVCLQKPCHGIRPMWTSVFFCGCRSNGQVLPKASPRVIFNWKNFIEQLKLILKWMLIERWTRPSMLSSICQHVARLQFDSCAEKDNLGGTVMMGLNWKWLDQCHGVRCHGKSSSQGWRKIVVQSKIDSWVFILVFAECDLCKFVWESIPTKAGLCRHQYWSVVAQATAKIRPRPAHRLFSIETTS